MDNHNGKRQRFQDTSNGDITMILKSTAPVSIIANAAITSQGNEKSSYVLQSIRRRIVAFEPNIYICKILMLACLTKEAYYPTYVSYIARQRRREIMSRKRKRPLRNATVLQVKTVAMKSKASLARAKRKDLLETKKFKQKSEYFDIGDPIYECEHCKAQMWIGENVERAKLSTPKFSLCCLKGKVVLPILAKPPQLMRDLLENRHDKSNKFIEDIRENRKNTVSKEMPYDFDDSIITNLKQMIDENSPYAKIYRMAADHISRYSSVDVKLRLIESRYKDGRAYNIPTAPEVAALIVGDIESMPDKRDVIVEKNSGELQRIDEFHPSYLPLQLQWIRHNQPTLRSERYNNLKDLKSKGNTETSAVGKPFILLSSFTGGKRYMIQNYQDAMAICKWTGYPSLFITFTRNPKWPEITKFVNKRGLRPEDRHDISVRIFKLKLDELLTDLKQSKVFVRHTACLPHAHVVLFLKCEDQHHMIENIDDFICAELPDREKDPELFDAVAECMIQGPRGPERMSSPCMVDSKCSKRFPKDYMERTKLDDNGYPAYRRRDTSATLDKNGILLDNRFVVPYNAFLIMKYRAHINVEYCNQGQSVKYLFKYINKASDRMDARITNTNNEISEDADCRYISACEVMWRIFEFPIHYRTPHVERLSFHLGGEQTCVFREGDYIDNVLVKNTIAESQFLQWMEINENSVEARQWLYSEFTQHYL
ncbi:hypothetical protein OROMI_024623 [Orobanche minor]